MPHWKTEGVTHKRKQGIYRTRNPVEISASLERKVRNELTASPIDKAAAELPNFFSGNQGRLRVGASLEELTGLEKLDRRIPLIDSNRIPYLVLSLAGASQTASTR